MSIEILETIIWKLTSQEEPKEYGYYLVCHEDSSIEIYSYAKIGGSKGNWWNKNGEHVYRPIYWTKVRTPIE
jgi:hypothetical protein